MNPWLPIRCSNPTYQQVFSALRLSPSPICDFQSPIFPVLRRLPLGLRLHTLGSCAAAYIGCCLDRVDEKLLQFLAPSPLPGPHDHQIHLICSPAVLQPGSPWHPVFLSYPRVVRFQKQKRNKEKKDKSLV